MARLVNKINVLIKSRINNVLKDVTARSDTDSTQPTTGAEADKNVARLRKQIDEALDREDRTTAEIAAMQDQIAEWDRQADAALKQGDDRAARQLVRQIQRAQQQRAMLAADLDQHRRSTSELIRRVNVLEAVIAEVRQRDNHPAPDHTAPDHTADGDRDSQSLADRLRQATSDAESVSQEIPSRQSETPVVIDEHAIEDDLARRRNRLSM